MLNLSIVLEDSARRHPDRPALVLGERALTYADVDATANRVANLLRSRGIGRGDRVLVLCPNIPDFVAIYFGILKAGAVVVPVNTLLKSRELEYHLRDSEAVAFFCFAGTPDLHSGDEGRQAFAAVDGCRELFVVGNPADPAEQLSTHVADQSTANPGALADESDVAVILYTSGTTGQPKGAQLSHSNLLMNALASMRLLDVTASTHDTHLLALPLFHSFGSTVQMNAGFAAGSTLVLMPRFDPKAALQLMLANEVTVFAGVPTMYWALLNALDETVDVERLRGNLRMAVSGGSALPVQILQDFQTRFGIGILEGYGLSETSPVATFNQPGRPNKAGSIGEPVWGVEVKLIDPEWNTIDADDTVGDGTALSARIQRFAADRPVRGFGAAAVARGAIACPHVRGAGRSSIMAKTPAVFQAFERCAAGVRERLLITRASRLDKEFHFQNWFRARLESTGLKHEQGGRNTYPISAWSRRPKASR